MSKYHPFQSLSFVLLMFLLRSLQSGSLLKVSLFCFLFFFFIVGAITCILSLICALALAYLDRRAERILHKEQGKTGKSRCKKSGTSGNDDLSEISGNDACS